MTSILIVDKQWIFSFALKHFILAGMPETKVELCNQETDLLVELKKARYDLLILDVTFISGLSGPMAVSYILSQTPLLKILVVCESNERGLIRQYFKKGVFGYIERDTSERGFKAALFAINKGDIYLDGQLFLSMLTAEGSMKKKKAPPIKALTIRQKEIMTLLLEGKPQSEISLKLGLKPSTISTHKLNILNKMGVNNIGELLYKIQSLDNNRPIKQAKKQTVSPFE